MSIDTSAVQHADILAITGDRAEAVRLERLFTENAQSVIAAVASGDMSTLSPAEQDALQTLLAGEDNDQLIKLLESRYNSATITRRDENDNGK